MQEGNSTRTEWCLIGRISTMEFIGKEVIFYGAGCHLYFTNMTTLENSTYNANNSRCGDGIKCYMGHRSLNFFCFAEHCGNPNIYVMSYPKFEIISILEGGSREGYITLAFSETSILVSLGSLPYFNMTVWNWRKGEKLGSSRTHIYRQRQTLKCNTLHPVRVSQLGYKTSKLHIWDILMCGKKCIMTHHKVKMPVDKPAPLVLTNWSTDGLLYALDNDGSVFIMNSEYVLERIITHNKLGSRIPFFTLWKSDIVVTGPNPGIRFYKKTSTGTWDLYNTLTPNEVVVKIKANKNDILIGLTERAYLMRIDIDNKKYQFIKTNETDYHNICILYPVGEYICLLSQGNMISVIEIITGNVVGSYDLMGTALTINGNPEFPYIGIGYINGIIELLSLYDPKNPVSMIQFNLTTNQISSVYFSDFGRVIVAADTAVGEFFILEGIPGGYIKVIATISTNVQIADYTLVPSTKCYRLFVIPVTSNEFIKGNKIIRYCITENHQIEVKEFHFQRDKCYARILSTPRINRDRVFYAMPFNSRSIEEVEIRRGDSNIRILDTFETAHQVRRNGCYIDKYHAVSWSYDGSIIASTPDMRHVIGHALPHHRRDGGIRKANIDPLGKYIITLGNDNIVVCTNLLHVQPDYQKQEDLKKLLSSDRYALLFQRKTRGFDPGPAMRDYTWLEVDRMKKIELEKKMCENEKAAINAEYQLIKYELKNLLNQNLDGPENERLDLVEFNLDLKYFREIQEMNRVECKETEQYIKKYIAAVYRVCDNIKNLCYNSMAVHKKKLRGLGSSVNVESYTLLPPDGQRMEELKWVMEQLRLERFLSEGDVFAPWIPTTLSDLKRFLSRQPQLPAAKAKPIEDLEEEGESITVDKDSIIAMAGTTAQNFIEISPYKYNQFETQTFHQLQLNAAVTIEDSVRLREYFNKAFDNVMQQKSREMTQIKEKNQRLRHIVNEINYFSTDQMYIHIKDPVWTPLEDIEKIVTVEDSQVPIPPYISPSEQAILDAKAAEAERIRLLLLADDFRERALMTMMNGVLEVRWEDELKKDVPLPKCMVEKQPEEFNEEDLRAVKDYEEKVKFLNSERERYKNILDQEYTKIIGQIKESLKKFDSRVNELLHLKIKVDEARTQEILILCKERVKLLDLMAFVEKEVDIKKIMVGNEELIHSIQNLIESLHDSIMDCRNQIEIVQNREKYLDKTLKKEMSEFNQVIQEAAVKLLKRRPKLNYKNIISSTMLQALAKSVITKEKPPTLTDECIDYLNALDHMDNYTGVPPTVDEEAYAVICKHRRLRIEHEIKMKSASQALTEAEATVGILQKRLNQKKELNVRCMADLAHARTDRLKRMKNMQVQMVLKQGFVEVPMTGNISDFHDAILIPRKEVEDINSLILENGRIKLNTMRHTMTFHREIMKMEWTHKKLRMHIEDLKEELNDIGNIKVTKEMQIYLKGVEKALPFEVGLELVKNSYELMIKEKKDGVAKLKRQTKVLREQSKKLDSEISDINVDVCECKLDKDWELDEEERRQVTERMRALAARSKLIKKIQENHQTMLLMQTELELLRLRTYPTIKYKILS